MKRSSLESPHQDESNGGNIMSLGVVGVEIFNEMITIQHLTFTILRLYMKLKLFLLLQL